MTEEQSKALAQSIPSAGQVLACTNAATRKYETTFCDDIRFSDGTTLKAFKSESATITSLNLANAKITALSKNVDTLLKCIELLNAQIELLKAEVLK